MERSENASYTPFSGTGGGLRRSPFALVGRTGRELRRSERSAFSLSPPFLRSFRSARSFSFRSARSFSKNFHDFR
jgi:hypothetical protein